MPQAILFVRRLTNSIYERCSRQMKQKKSKICGRGLNASWSPPHPPSKEAAIPDHARKGLEK